MKTKKRYINTRLTLQGVPKSNLDAKQINIILKEALVKYFLSNEQYFGFEIHSDEVKL